MPDRTQDLKNHRQVAVACKNYTDKEIKASEERILSIVARNNVDFIDHINEPTYRFTAPANAKLLMLQSIAGNSNKIAPSTPSDDSVARLKTIPDNTYKSQIDYIGGKTVKYNQLFTSKSLMTRTAKGLTIVQNGYKCVVNGTFTGTRQDEVDAIGDASSSVVSVIKDHIYLSVAPTLPSGISGDNIQVGNSTTFNYKKSNGSTITKCLKSGNTYSYGRLSNLANGTTFNNYEMYYNLIDLTDIFGAGNEPTTVEEAIPLLKANGYKLDGTDTYSTDSLKHAIVSGVKYSGNYLDIEDIYAQNQIVNPNGDFLDNNLYNIYKINIPANTYTISFYNDNSQASVFSFVSYNGAIRTANEYYRNVVSGNNVITFTLPKDTNIIYISIAKHYTNVMLVRGSTAPSTYIPYAQPKLLTIPSQVLADVRYGLGFDDNNYNHLDIDGHLRGNVLKEDMSTFNWTYSSSYDTYAYIQNFSVANAKCLAILPSPFENVSINNNGNLLLTFASGSFANLNKLTQALSGIYLIYQSSSSFDQDYSQYFTDDWNKVDLDKQYATVEMVVDEPIDMPNKVEYYGTIIHSLATAVKQDGFNVWDEETELGSIYQDTGGNNNNVTNQIRSKNHISVIPNTTYYIKSTQNVYIRYYDINKGVIGTVWNVSNNKNTTFTTSDDCYYIRFIVVDSTTYNHDICINISGTLNGTYKSYKAPITRLLPNSEAKYSWGITDGVRNTRVFCDDEGNPVNEGSLVVGNQDLGGLTYAKDTNRIATLGLADFLKDIASTDTYNLLCPNYIASSFNNVYSHTSDYLIGVRYTNKELSIWDNYWYNNWNATAFKSVMDGVPLFYEKNATDTETLDDFDFSFDCEEGDTFTIIGCELLQCYATYSFLIKEAKSNE